MTRVDMAERLRLPSRRGADRDAERRGARSVVAARATRPRRVLIVGQTPPPYHGQAIAIENIVKASYEAVEISHVRLQFSRALNEVSQFRMRKVLHLVGTVIRIVFFRFRHRIDILYYPPAGPDRIAIWRDFLILIPTRPLYRKTVFHFHASGLSTMYSRLSLLERVLFRVAYGEPTGAIRLATDTEPDAEFVRARSEFIIPYGIGDRYRDFAAARVPHKIVPRILWVSNLHESKGIFVLLDACEILRRRGIPFELHVIGAPASEAVNDRIERRLEQAGIKNSVQSLGPLTGDNKWRAFANGDVFCLPTFYEREGMPLVILEAMQFALPVVATDWRGIPAMVKDGETGFLVPVRDTVATADRLERLLRDSGLRQTLGASARAEFERNFTLQIFRQRIEKVLLSV